MPSKEEIRNTIRTLGIPRTTVAKLSGMYLSDLSAWLNNRAELNPVRVFRVSEVVGQIAELVQASDQLHIKFDLRDPENVRRIIGAIQIQRAQEQLESAQLEVATALKELAQ